MKMEVEQHPDKTFIGKVEREFDFLGYFLKPGILSVSVVTINNFVERISRLYEQGADYVRIGEYVRHWFKWVKTGIIVDVRSAIEYKVIHAVGALHIPVSKKDFINKVSKLRSENATKKLAFYCNGTTCLKSYVATDKAMKGNIANVSAYDAGIPEWVSTYPGKTLLLGEVVTDPEKQIIPKSEFKKKTISYEDFKAAASTGGVIIDVRDAMQRSGDLPGLGKTLKIPMDAFIQNFVQKKKNQDKSLFIFDQVGKQVRWLEYYLVKNGYTDYTFLKGGATTVLKDQKYKK